MRIKLYERCCTDRWTIGISDEPIFKIQLAATTPTGIIFQLAGVQHREEKVVYDRYHNNERGSRYRWDLTVGI